MKLFISIIILVFVSFSCIKEKISPKSINNSATTTNSVEDTNSIYIKNFDSTSVKINGSLFINEKVTNVTFTVKYIAGNGKSYIDRNFESTEVSGLTATLQEGKLAKGDGFFTFIVSGTPDKIGDATFTIIFANQKCKVKLKVTEVLIPKLDCANIKTFGKLTAEIPVQDSYFTIEYSENDRSFSILELNSIGVYGLKATPNYTKISDKFGDIKYLFSGTPKSSGEAIFNIKIGNNQCELIIPVLPSPFNKVTDIDGHYYKTVKIGTQEWMAEDLAVTKYNDGTTIPLVSEDNQWITTKTGAYCNRYTVLYNGYVAVNVDKNVCPVGWHVPTKEDWEKLINYLGDNSSIKLRAISFNGTNLSLFNALPNGSRGVIDYGKYTGAYSGKGSFSNFWSSTSNYSNAFNIVLFTLDTEVNMQSWSDLNNGESIRCVKD